MLNYFIVEILWTNGIYFIFFGVLTLWIYKKLDRNYLIEKGIPGTKLSRLNVIGHAHYIPHGSVHLQRYDSHMYLLQTLSAFSQLHLQDNLYVLWLFNLPVIVLHKAQSIESLYSSTTILNKAISYEMLHPWLGTGLLTSSKEKWKTRRKLLTPSFHFNILKEFLPIINEQAQVLVEIIKNSVEKEWVNIMELMTLCSLDVICETALGVNINAQRNKDSEYVKAVLRASECAMHRMFNPLQWIDFFYYKSNGGRQFRKDIDTLHAFTKEVIRKKKNIHQIGTIKETPSNGIYNKRKVFMDLLLDYHMTHKEFTENDIQEELDTFTFEGHDTTAMGLSWTFFLIGLHSEVQNKVHDELDRILYDENCEITNDNLGEMKYLERVIKESLRLYPSVPFTGRQITEDTNLCGHLIPKGTEVVEFIYGLHRDSNVFPNPEVFDPDRFLPENNKDRHPFAYVPFAAGSRNCIGQRFAMMELKTILATVLKRYSVKSLDSRDKVLPSANLVLRPSHPMRMKIVPRFKVSS